MNIYDVAKAAGVSHQTVSNVLNNPSKVRHVTAQKVHKAIRDLGFEVNSAARSLGAGRTNVIGFEIPPTSESRNGFLDHFMLPFAVAAQARGYRVMMFAAEHTDGRDHKKLLNSNLVDGVVITDTCVDDSRVAALLEASIPFVAFGRTATTRPFSWVDVDNSYAMELALGRFADAGHHEVLYVDSDADRFYLSERATSAAVVAAQRSMRVDHVRIDRNVDVRELLAERLSSARPPTAVIAGSDLLAAAAVDVLKSLGREVSLQSSAVIGFDDTALASVTDPPITTIHQPVDEIIQQILALLVQELRGEPGEPTLLTPTLTVRSSG